MSKLPLEYALIEFKGNKLTGKIVPELLDLAERGLVRYVDLVFIQKEKDGSTRTVELNDLEPDAYKMFVPLGKNLGSLFTDEDLETAARKLPKNSAAMLLMWESLWSEYFRRAVLEANGKLVARGQIVVQGRNKARTGKKTAAKKNAASKKK